MNDKWPDISSHACLVVLFSTAAICKASSSFLLLVIHEKNVTHITTEGQRDVSIPTQIYSCGQVRAHVDMICLFFVLSGSDLFLMHRAALRCIQFRQLGRNRRFLNVLDFECECVFGLSLEFSFSVSHWRLAASF